MGTEYTFTAENLPPKGEVGMLRCGPAHFKFWLGDWAMGWAMSSPKAAHKLKEDKTGFPFCDSHWATPAEMTAARATPEQAQEWAHPSVRGDALWYPPVPEGGAGWIELPDGCAPMLPESAEGWILYKDDRRGGTVNWSNSGVSFELGELMTRPDIVATLCAYCLKLSTPAEPQQATRPAPPLPPAVKRIPPLPRAGLTQAELSDIFECFEGLSDQPTPKAPDGFDHIRAKYDFSRFRA